MLVTLRAAEGTFEARSSDGISVVVKDSGATVELTGTSSKIEEYLDTVSSIKYLGAQDDFGTPADTNTVTLDDLEGGQTTLGVINVDLNQIDEPVIGSAPTGGGLFTTGSGDDLIKDFEDGYDLIDVRGWGYEFAEQLAYNEFDVTIAPGQGYTITNGDDSIKIKNTSGEGIHLTADDFIFDYFYDVG